jgi:replication-associated recombination protein RarA
MKTHSFSVVLTGRRDQYSEEDLDDMADCLYECGCDDATLIISEGIIYLDFDRKAISMVTAIESAKADVRRAGYEVDRIVE